MSALRTLDTSPSGLNAAFARYARRCALVLTDVFDRPRDQRDLSTWLITRYRTSDPAEFLHEDPLNRVARYLRLEPSQISLAQREAAARLKRDQIWYDNP
jgi:hypothetical protein